MAPRTDFIERREDLHAAKFVAGEGSEDRLKTGQVRLRVEKFALTANNITYAVYGDAIGYWGYFPAAEPGWGRPPVWGFGRVVASCHDDIEVGRRYYGFFPISSYLTIKAKPNTAGMRDDSEHRLVLPKAYNQYSDTERDPVYDAKHEDEQIDGSLLDEFRRS